MHAFLVLAFLSTDYNPRCRSSYPQITILDARILVNRSPFSRLAFTSTDHHLRRRMLGDWTGVSVNWIILLPCFHQRSSALSSPKCHSSEQGSGIPRCQTSSRFRSHHNPFCELQCCHALHSTLAVAFDLATANTVCSTDEQVDTSTLAMRCPRPLLSWKYNHFQLRIVPLLPADLNSQCTLRSGQPLRR